MAGAGRGTIRVANAGGVVTTTLLKRIAEFALEEINRGKDSLSGVVFDTSQQTVSFRWWLGINRTGSGSCGDEDRSNDGEDSSGELHFGGGEKSKINLNS